MANLAYKKSNSKWTILGVGTGGSAKTPALASWAALGPLRLYNFDGESRLDPIIDFYTRVCPRPDIIGNIEYMNVGLSNFEEFMKDFEALQDRCEYATVMLDSITSASVTCIKWLLMKTLKTKDKDKVRLSGGESGIAIPSWPEWNGEAMFLTSILEIGKTIDAHFITTAHPMQRTAVEGNGKNLKGSIYTSLVSGGVKGVDLIPNYFNEIWKFGVDTSYSEKGVTTRRIIDTVKETSEDLTKNTCGLPPEVDFTNKVLFDVIKEKMRKEVVTVK